MSTLSFQPEDFTPPGRRPPVPVVEAHGDHVHSRVPGEFPRCHRATGACVATLLDPPPVAGAPGGADAMMTADMVRAVLANVRQAHIDQGPARSAKAVRRMVAHMRPAHTDPEGTP